MLWQLLLFQLVAPLALLGWLAFLPLRSQMGVAAQVVATGLYLAALLRIGVWLFPPWWTGYVYLALWLVATAIAARRREDRPLWGRRALDLSGLAAMVVLAGYTAAVMIDAARGLRPTTLVVDLAPPLKGEGYYVTSGGSTEPINAHVRTLDPTTERMASFRGQSYGVDIVKLDRWGMHATGIQPADPAAYLIFGEPIYAPCAGRVLQAEDGHADMPVPEADLQNLPGNHVLLECGDVVVLLAHMKKGSVEVADGQVVAIGDRVGLVGNSGNTGEPHLHIHAQRRAPPEAPLSGQPIQMRIAGKFLVRNDRLDAVR